MVDATYKLLDLKMPVSVLLAVNGHGLSKIVGLFVVLQICLFHTLRTFKREITMDKMGITSGERDRCLEILTKITYSRSPEEYQLNLDLLKSTKDDSVVS